MNHLCSSASPLSLQHVTLFISSKTHYNIFTAVPLAWGLQGKLSCVTFQIFWKEPKLFLVAALLLPNPGASEAQLLSGFHLVSKKYLKVFKKYFQRFLRGDLWLIERIGDAVSDMQWLCRAHIITRPYWEAKGFSKSTLLTAHWCSHCISCTHSATVSRLNTGAQHTNDNREVHLLHSLHTKACFIYPTWILHTKYHTDYSKYFAWGWS